MVGGEKPYSKFDDEQEAAEAPGAQPSGSRTFRGRSFMETLGEVAEEAAARRHSIRSADRHLSYVTSDNPALNSWNVLGELRGTSVTEEGRSNSQSQVPRYDERALLASASAKDRSFAGTVLQPASRMCSIKEGRQACRGDANEGAADEEWGDDPDEKVGLKKGRRGGHEAPKEEEELQEDSFRRQHPVLHWISLRWWPGANLWGLAICIGLGLVIKLAVPKPDELTDQAWNMLSIFAATIAGLILEPLPTGGVAYVAMTVVLVTGILDFKTAFMSFTNDTIWLIVSAFFFARGVEKTGLGERLANYFIRLFGSGALGLSYALVAAETCLAAAMPSTTARAGGIFVPMLSNLAKQFESYPRDRSARLIGAFLLMAQFQAGINSSAMFLTGAAQNSLCLTLAAEQGVEIDNAWTLWLKNSIVPAGLGLLLTPLLVFLVYPPKIKRTPEAKGDARVRLADMGRATWDEWVMGAVLIIAIGFWIGGKYLPVPMSSTTVAFMAMSLLLLTGVLTWRDAISYAPAWDTLFWFGVLIGFSSQLNSLGVINWIADSISAPLAAAGLPAYATFLIVELAYFFIHYLFASQTAHVTALYPAFLAVLLKLGMDPVLSAMSLAYVSNLFGSITHFSAGQAAVYYGEGYLPMQIILVIGFIFAVFNLALWLGLGMLWWRLMGLYDSVFVGVPPELAPAPGPGT